MILIRFILICLIVYLLVKGFVRSLFLEDPPERDRRPSPRQDKSQEKKVSKEVGEYIDYEEVE